jgi:hypothetical protein
LRRGVRKVNLKTTRPALPARDEKTSKSPYFDVSPELDPGNRK